MSTLTPVQSDIGLCSSGSCRTGESDFATAWADASSQNFYFFEGGDVRGLTRIETFAGLISYCVVLT